MPPRHGKSELVSRRLPAFIYGLNPRAQIIACSYGADLACRMNRDVQRIMESESYAKLFPDTRLGGSNVRSVNEGTVLKNSDIFEIVKHGGVYRCAGTGGGITGMGGDFILIDDPIKDGKEAMSPGQRDTVWEWYQSTLYSRLETTFDDGTKQVSDGGILVTATRWHEDDLIGRLLAAAKADPEADQWEILELPAIKEEGGDALDIRAVGDALWPEKYPQSKLDRLKRAIGTMWWNALYQCRPSAQEGGQIKRKWFIHFYKELPNRFDEWLQSWDATFKDKKENDYVVGQVWARKGADKYLIAETRDQLDITATMNAIRLMTARYPRTYLKLIEDKANGPAIISMMKGEVSGIVPVEPEGGKPARVQAIAPDVEAGNIWLPDPSIAPWILDWIEEIVNFPNAKHDDRVDAFSQAVWRMRQASSGGFTEDMIPDRIESITASVTGAKRW